MTGLLVGRARARARIVRRWRPIARHPDPWRQGFWENELLAPTPPHHAI
jgi:hypothetical protein